MKVFSIALFSVSPATPPQAVSLGAAQDLSSFSFYQRGSVGEFMTFFTKVGFLSRWQASANDTNVS
jgi:synaptobrevin family protein YKT6